MTPGETTPVSLTKEEIELIQGTFEETEFDDTDPEDEEEGDTKEEPPEEPPEGSDAAVAESIQKKLEEALKHF